MKLVKTLALAFLATFLLAAPVTAAVQDYPTVEWSEISYENWSGDTERIKITLDGVVGKSLKEGKNAYTADMPFIFLGLWDVMSNEDGTYTAWTDDNEEVTLTKEEMIRDYRDDSIIAIPVVDGATLTITNLVDPEIPLEFYPGGYSFVDDEKTILSKIGGQMGNYSSFYPETFELRKDATGGMNDFTLDFPILGLMLGGSPVDLQILVVSEEKARELLATITEEDIKAAQTDGEVAPAKENPVKTDYTAEPTTTNIELNGEPVAFDAYLIESNNYIKLRDLAMVLSGTEKQFNVTWDQEKQAINMFSDTPYESVGGEMASGGGVSESAIISTATIYKDDKEISLRAFTIKGNNYFKLRDIAKAFDFGVTWNQETFTAGIDTSSSYQE